MSDAIRDALLSAWLDLVAALELSDDDLVDPGFVSDVLGDLTTDLRSSLSQSDRALLVKLIRQHAARESDPERREVFEETPEHFGLIDDP
ncbi:hypothetical protein BJY16_006623 [Actinoplanes octamycinicus]|uniref:Uncharacterized protein n=1 Tax=Actinoplanes octamycinicus TaxID=135948 RepID=A0A7W7MAK6_9ACTN|nr:hypothetical protein [Actinoplanes octamycinicus]MBB4743164.1 hypothetical protein [Actinoplanes octamycinicus]GIE61274.1 hypothetical protein Aoc01nite_66760 [Actinoplanes octamycinicus]